MRFVNRSSRSSVDAWNPAAALALARAISGVTQSAPSIRSHAIRWPASSTTRCGAPGVTSPRAAARMTLTDSPRLRLRLALPSQTRLHLVLQDVGAMEPAHVLPAHLRRLPDLLERLRLLLGRGRVPLD